MYQILVQKRFYSLPFFMKDKIALLTQSLVLVTRTFMNTAAWDLTNVTNTHFSEIVAHGYTRALFSVEPLRYCFYF